MEDYYTIQTEGLQSELFAELHTLQKQGVLCDVILAAEDGEVMAHKVILMAASKYFREKLSPVVSANPSRICLKGISVVELANLVKYIYTGKLLVAKETMDVTLEVSEILELTGVTQGYKDIVTYEQMKTDGESLPGGDGVQEVNMTEPAGGLKESSTATTIGSNTDITSKGESQSDTAVLAATSTASEQPENQVAESQEVRVTEYFQDGTSRVYTADHPEQAQTGTSHTSNEYQFEFNPYDKQYMDVSVGANVQATTTIPNVPRLQKMVSADEQARHQDLLKVAIETLSDPSHFIGGIPKPVGETETAVANVTTEIVEPATSGTGYQNGQIESKIVTLNAGTVANELGGQTSVYTVALDPSSITKPLLMPRILRKKSEKEKQAEMAAKMYRKKKADLLNRTAIMTHVAQKDPVGKGIYQPTAKLVQDAGGAAEEPKSTKRTPKILLRSSSPRKKEIVQPDQLQHIMIYRSLDGQVTTSKMTGSKQETEQSPVKHENVEMSESAREFGQVVNFDSDNNEDESLESAVIGVEKNIESNNKVTENISTERSSPDTSDSVTVAGKSKTEVVKIIRTRGAAKKEAESSKDSEEGQVQSEVSKGINKEVEDSESEVLQTPDKNRKDNNQSPLFDSHDAHTRSSATKRKGKVPRRIPLDEDPDSKNKIPLVRTRKNSRTETAVGTSRSVRTTRARSVNLDGTEATEKNKNVNETKTVKITEAKLDDSCDIDDNSGDIEETETTGIQCSTDSKKLRDQEKKHLSDGKLKDSQQEVQNKETTAGEIIHTDKDIIYLFRSNVEKSAKDVTEEFDNCDDTLKEKDDGSKSEHSSEIDLEMTVDDIDQTEDQAVSAKRKADSDAEDMPVKRQKSASESAGREAGDNRKGEVKLKAIRTSTGRIMYLCPETDCKCLGNTLSSIRKHQAFVHGGTDKTLKQPCAVLRKEVTSEVTAKSKVVKVMRKETLTCDCCNTTFGTATELQAHVKEMTVCVDCNQKFHSQFDLLCHRSRSHGDAVPKAASSYSCPLCKYVDYTFKGIDNHMATHEGSYIQCVSCTKCFRTFAEMKKHLVTHSEKKYKCSSCPFVSNVMACVTIHHRLKHSDNKEMAECQFCNYKTPLHGNLRKHMLTGHGLVVVTKQSHENREKYRDYPEGTMLTATGEVFDPETMQVPKMSQRKFLDEKEGESESIKTVKEKQKPVKEEKLDTHADKRRRPALHKLSTDEFTREVLKRHHEYLTQPEKNQRFMSQSLARATAHPSFPQASPSVRQTKADKIYNAPKVPHRFQDLSCTESQEYITAVASNVPTAVNEIEVIHHDTATVVTENVEDGVQTVLAIPETSGASELEQFIVVTNDGKESVMPTKELYHALMQRENSMETKETIGVINALLAAGTEVQFEEQDVRHIEIQNE